MYWLQRRLLSQNFLVNRELVSKLIRDSSISSTDTVLEIGSGKGIITKELRKVTSNVITVEKDPALTPYPQDFLTYQLPTEPYKVFSNIPFGITGDVVRKLLQANNHPKDAYLVMQKEAADKFIVHPNTNTMAAILYYPFWDIQVVHRFQRNDFSPQPRVDSVLLHIQPKANSLILDVKKSLFQDFVAFNFIHDKHAKFIPSQKWLSLFDAFLQNPQKIHTAKGSFTKLQQKQKSLEKIHRSRTDNNWRKFRRK